MVWARRVWPPGVSVKPQSRPRKISPRKLAQKVLLIGWDAADWKVITPLLDAGQMPALESVINQGVMGNLATLRPILSPLLWNSIATGKRPDKHGILDFFEPDPHYGGIRPVTSTSRKVKAIWNILTQRGFKSHVVGWFAGHPAEPINGVAISPLYPLPKFATPDPWPLAENSVHPPSLAQTFAELRIHPAELSAEEILPFVPRAAEVNQKEDHAIEQLAKVIAETCTIHNAATWILENQEWDFLAIFYNAIDHFCHRFMQYYPPAPKAIPEQEAEIYKDVVPSAYRFQDLLLRRMLAFAGPDTAVIILSDHGFHSDHLRPRLTPNEPAGPTIWHRPIGIISMCGPGIRQDERIYGANLLDITPTILTLFGLPVGQDMDGRVITQAFEETPQIEVIPSWEDEPGESGMHPEDQRMDAEAAKAMIEQFVALGYLNPPPEGKARVVDVVIREQKFNLARVYLDKWQFVDALPLLEELNEQWPEELRFALELSRCYLELGRRDDAADVLAEEVKHGKPGWADWLMGVNYSERGDDQMAMEHLLRAEKANPRLPDLHLRIGDVYRRMRRWEDARRSYRRALKLDADSAGSYLGLAMVALAQKRN
ncbi:MAG TPA: alkaline phosphatase family protein, partial [Bryobacteraceae bacterium]|nr:alkaline phosphatase family protein [Bryobacteraceae bacterium]